MQPQSPKVTEAEVTRLLLISTILILLAATLATASTLTRIRPAAITLGQLTFVFNPHEHRTNRVRRQVHESVHRRQFQQHGVVSFVLSYIFDREQRLRWQARAIAAELCYVRALDPPAVPAMARFRARALQPTHSSRPPTMRELKVVWPMRRLRNEQ